MKTLLAIVMISIGAASAFTVPVQAASLTISGDDGGVYIRRHHSRDHYDNYGDRRYGDMQYGDRQYRHHRHHCRTEIIQHWRHHHRVIEQVTMCG